MVTKSTLFHPCTLVIILVGEKRLVYKFQLKLIALRTVLCPLPSQTDLIKYSVCDFLSRFVLSSVRRLPVLYY